MNIPQQRRRNKVLGHANNFFDDLASESNGLITSNLQLSHQLDGLVEGTRSDDKGRLDDSGNLLLTMVDNARSDDNGQLSKADRLLNNTSTGIHRRLHDSLDLLADDVDILDYLGDADSHRVDQGVVVVGAELLLELRFDRLEVAHGVGDGRADDGGDDGGSDASDRFGEEGEHFE